MNYNVNTPISDAENYTKFTKSCIMNESDLANYINCVRCNNLSAGRKVSATTFIRNNEALFNEYLDALETKDKLHVVWKLSDNTISNCLYKELFDELLDYVIDHVDDLITTIHAMHSTAFMVKSLLYHYHNYLRQLDSIDDSDIERILSVWYSIPCYYAVSTSTTDYRVVCQHKDFKRVFHRFKLTNPLYDSNNNVTEIIQDTL